MKCIYTERLILTKEEVSILDKAEKVLENIYEESKDNGEIEKLSGTALENIRELLSDDYSNME